MSERIEEIKEATKMLVVKAWKEEQSVTTVVTKINFLWAEYLTQLEAKRDEAVRRAVEAERERIKTWLKEEDFPLRKVGVADDFFSDAKVVRVDHLLEALTPPSRDSSSEGNSKQYE